MTKCRSSQPVAECPRTGRMCKTSGSTDPTDLASFGEEEDDKSVKLKKYFSWWEPGHSENEYGNFRTDPGGGRCSTQNPLTALARKKIMRRAQQNLLEEEGQAC